MAAIGAVSLMFLTVTAVLPYACSESLVVVNSGVEVARGRSVFVTDTELSINVDPTADCKVEVVLNEPVTQRVGTLTPQVGERCSLRGPFLIKNKIHGFSSAVTEPSLSPHTALSVTP